VNRVVIVGSGGAGKSTFARALGRSTGLPVVHLDREYWRPGWTKPTDAEWSARLDELLAGERWILDGNFSGTMARRFAAADTIVLLDLPTSTCLWRALRRRLLDRARPDLAVGCSEKIDLEFLRWIWRFRRKQRPKIMQRIAEHAADRRAFVLRSDADVRAFLTSVRRERESGYQTS
jgi:adenylate kinase family enzyme